MANTLTGSANASLALGASTSGRRIDGNISLSVTSDLFSRNTQSIPTSATALSLANLAGTTLGAYVIKNLDSTNYVDILTNTSGVTILHVMPEMIATGYFPSTITAPAAKSHTAACLLEYMICGA